MIRTNNLNWLVLALIVLFVLPSCQKEQERSQTILHDEVIAIEKDGPGDCDVITDLLAGQDILVGSVYVTHDEENIYVTYYVDEPGWCITETHMHIAAHVSQIPQTQRGNPKVGHFEYAGTHDCINEYTYTVPIQWAPNSDLVIAAHAVVSYDQGDGGARGGDEGGTETAWAEGHDFPGNSWAMYFDYFLCFESGGGIGPGIEIAYAWAPPSSLIPSPCFPQIPISDQWGYHIGPFSQEGTFELWALPTSCDRTNAILVGEAQVEFRGTKKMDISIMTYPGYSFHEANLWVDSSPWTVYGVVPEDFPFRAEDLSGASIYTFRNIPREGEDIYMILHTLVYGVVHYM